MGSSVSSMPASTYHTCVPFYTIKYKLVLVPISCEFKVENKLLIGPVFIQPTFEGMNKISLYHIIRQTVPNFNDPVTKRIFPYIISTHVLSVIASSTANWVKI